MSLASRSASASGTAKHAADVANDGAGLHCSEGYDLGDVAVFLADVVDNFAAAVLADVDIDIRHLVAVRVHKSLEEQIVADRVNVAKAEAVSDDCADGASSCGGGDIILVGVIAEVPDD